MTATGPDPYIPDMAVPVETFEVKPPSVREMLLGGGPRFARDAFGPPLAFYVGWKSAGLRRRHRAWRRFVSLLAWRSERRSGRPGFMARLSLAIVIVQARRRRSPPAASRCTWPSPCS